ncbi:MAG: helix-turn-helix transcriptional regulator [Ruminococcus sp.]|nr:helix-turn-helix transcriptional regulator [Ruminococcus sp.]
MDQAAIGKFISQCRKQKHLTQAQLAERLGVSDKAVSKWETGRSMPDASIMLDLCEQIDITVNDLFNARSATSPSIRKYSLRSTSTAQGK